MKIRILDRILVAAAGLLMLAGCAALAAQLFFGKDVVGWVTKVLTGEQYRIWLIIALALLVLLACYCILILFRHRGHRDKFVMQKTENGELSISLKAMESMVQKCLDPHKELTVQGVRLENLKGGLLIRIRGTVAGGVSIPLTVDALQQQIKQYVTACSGVEVKDIRVQIESSGPEAKESLFAIEAPTARALPGGSNAKEEKPKEKKEEPAQMPQEELEQVMAEMPAPLPSDAEDAAPVIEVSAAAAAAAEMVKSEAPQEEDDRPIHQRLFSNPEEPCVMPMPPVAEETENDKAEEVKPEEAKSEEAKTEEEKPADPEVQKALQEDNKEGGKEQ
ncbi:MAG: alkaline shock response membrane anchor protein AmaP [Clostridia bacterium]|nr:alkaline shock response membrane anchor protein AmaP [Clostridia bacterium]